MRRFALLLVALAAACTLGSGQAASVDPITALYQAAAPGSTVTIPCGTYPTATLAPHRSAGLNVVFEPAQPYCVTIGDVQNGSLDFTSGGDYSTWENLVLPGGIYQGGSSFLNGVTIDHDHLAVDVLATGTLNNFHLVNGLRFTNNTVGPTAPATAGISSPEGLRIGTPGGASSTNVVIDSNVIQSNLRSCQDWPATYLLDGVTKPAGPCQGVDCSASCHDDGMHFWGIASSAVTNNRLILTEVQGIYFENSNGVTGLQNRDITISGNSVTLADGSAAIYIEGNGTQPLISGMWTISNNTSPNLLEIGPFTGIAPGTVFNVSGNHTELLIANNSGNAIGCQDQPSSVTITYTGNTFIPVGGGTAVPCPGDGNPTPPPVPVPTPPPAPAPVPTLGLAASTMTVIWTPVKGATGYTLARDGVTLSTAGKGASSAKFSLTPGAHTLTVTAKPGGATQTLAVTTR